MNDDGVFDEDIQFGVSARYKEYLIPYVDNPGGMEERGGIIMMVYDDLSWTISVNINNSEVDIVQMHIISYNHIKNELQAQGKTKNDKAADILEWCNTIAKNYMLAKIKNNSEDAEEKREIRRNKKNNRLLFGVDSGESFTTLLNKSTDKDIIGDRFEG